MKQCPFCGADIEDSARFCLYCMQSLTEKEQIYPLQKKKPQWLLIIAAVIAVFVIIVFASLDNRSILGNKMPTGGTQLDSAPTSPPTETSDPTHIHNYCIENTDAECQKAAATCTSPAIYYYSCSCGEKSGDTFAYGKMADHTIVTERGYPATCKNPGLTDGTYCSICNTVFLSQVQIPVANHTYDNQQDESCNICNYIRMIHCDHAKIIKLPAVAPTCIASGLTEGEQCALCEEILTEQITLAPSGHTEVIDPAIEPTCISGGTTEGKHCSTCNAILAAQYPVAAKGHTKVTDQAVAATCTTEGKTEGSHCSVCQVVFVYQQPISALGHSFNSQDSTAPCSLCGALPHVHSFTEENTDAKYLKSPANCTSANIYYYSCVCGETGSRVFSSGTYIGHNVVVEPGYPASCTTSGLTDRVYCSTCNDSFEYHTTIPATGHAFSVGSSRSVCMDCGEYATLTINAPELPCVVNSFGFEKPFRIDRITYSLEPMTDGNFFIEFTFYGTNISSESALFNFSASLHGPNNTALGSSLSRYLNPNESGTFLAAAQIVDASGTYTLIFN